MIYVASKTKHADMWKEYRRQGVPNHIQLD